MKKRAGDSDVRARAAALSDNPDASSVQISILNNYGSPKTAFTGSLSQGTQLVVSIKFQAKHTLYIGAIELVDESDPTGAETQQLLNRTLYPPPPSLSTL